MCWTSVYYFTWDKPDCWALHVHTVLQPPYSRCVCAICASALLSGIKSDLKVERLNQWSQTALRCTLGCISPLPPSLPSNWPNGVVMNNTSSITFSTQMGRQVEGWRRTALCVVLHAIMQIRVWSSDIAPSTFTLLPCAICTLQVSSFCCWCNLSLQGCADVSFKSRVSGLFYSCFQWFMKCWFMLTVLW